MADPLPRAGLRPRLTLAFDRFVRSESFAGFLLAAAAAAGLAWANSPLAPLYGRLLHVEVARGFDLHHLVNDGLMAVFFLVVGLEIKRELREGELSRVREAALPMAAALGGMLVPAGLYALLNAGGPGAPGWGIPMATDIAFALGAMSLLGARVPVGLKVFLTALAIVDDLGAVLVIAVFYSGGLRGPELAGAAALLAVAALYARRDGRRLAVFLVVGAVVWLLTLRSGIHATVAGVLLAFTVPLSGERGAGSESPLHRLERALHPWVAYAVLPVFALANSGVPLAGFALGDVAAGTAAGLLLGKPVGVLLFSWLAVATGAAVLPRGATWLSLSAVAVLTGIGFTMSLFIAALALPDPGLLAQAKLGVLGSSMLAAAAGVALLAVALKRTRSVRRNPVAPDREGC